MGPGERPGSLGASGRRGRPKGASKWPTPQIPLKALVLSKVLILIVDGIVIRGACSGLRRRLRRHACQKGRIANAPTFQNAKSAYIILQLQSLDYYHCRHVDELQHAFKIQNDPTLCHTKEGVEVVEMHLRTRPTSGAEPNSLGTNHFPRV